MKAKVAWAAKKEGGIMDPITLLAIVTAIGAILDAIVGQGVGY
jgi:hypothetical protein